MVSNAVRLKDLDMVSDLRIQQERIQRLEMQLEQMTQKCQMAMDQREVYRKEVSQLGGTAPRDRLSVFGGRVWASVKERSSDGSMSEDDQTLLDMAVELGLCREEVYDLDKHDEDLQEFLTPGVDICYVWVV